jgi:hypothetical protein
MIYKEYPMANFVVMKGDEEVEVEDTPENRSKAKAKGLKTYEIMEKGGEESLIHSDLLEKAAKKGYSLKRDPVSGLESGGRGLLDTATLGYDDEIYGRYKQLTSDESYENARDRARRTKREAEEDNPKSYLAGQVGGAVGSSMLIPGGGLKGATTLAKVANAAKSGALVGGVAGIGSSDKEDISGIASDAAKNAAGGAIVGGGITAAGKVLTKGTDLIPSSFKEKVYKGIGDIDDKMAEIIKERPHLVRKADDALEPSHIGDKLAERIDELEGLAAKQSEKAWDKLKSIDNKYSNASLSNIAKEAIKIADDHGLRKQAQAAQRAALAKLKDATSDVVRAKNFSDLKSAIEAMDENINWEILENKLSNRVLMRFRTAVDKELKANSPAYKEAMKDLSNTVDSISKLRRNFGVKRGAEEFADGTRSASYSTDRTTNKVDAMRKQAFGPKNDKLKDTIRKAAPDVAEDIDTAAMKNYMERDIGRGSRSPVVGAATGALLPWLGPIVGGALGYARDKGGREFGARGLAKIGERAQRIIDSSDGPFQELLQKAARRGGGAAVILYHNLLKEKYPEYKNATEE